MGWLLFGVLGLAGLAGVLWLSARTVALAQAAMSTANAPTATLPPALVAVSTGLPTTAAPIQTPTAPSAPTATPQPTSTLLPSDAEATAQAAACAAYDRTPVDLLTLVDRDTALARDFVPEDLAEVALDQSNLAFRPIPLRRAVHQPLLDMVAAMDEAGLSVWVMSGYRTYGEQQLAYDKWLALYPDRVDDISAKPGHSEHQLGTAVDFSTPYMDDLYGDFFNIRFERTPEGEWLAQQATNYGFTLSYPAWAVEETGYASEPWHYRYVGGLALELKARNLTLTQYLRECGTLAQ